MISRLPGIYKKESVLVTHLRDYADPVVFMYGPQGGEKYRLSASKEELVKFAKKILEWAGENSHE